MATLLSYALTSVSDVKESLGIDSSDSSKNNLIIRKINQATKAIENYCGRRFALTEYTNVYYDGTQGNQLVLRQRPITELSAFGIRDNNFNEDDWDSIESDLYFIDAAAGIVDLNFNATGSWDRYRLSYKAGYGTIPEDLAEACVSLACFYYNSSNALAVGVSKVKEGQREVSYANATQNFTGILQTLGIDDIINSYANNPVMTDR